MSQVQDQDEVQDQAPAPAPPPSGVLLGRVTCDGGRAVYELYSGFKWRVTVDGRDRPETAHGLEVYYADQFRGPSCGAPGERLLIEMAREWGGTAEYLGPYKGADPNVVY